MGILHNWYRVTIIKQTISMEVGRLATCQFLWYWRALTAITLYHYGDVSVSVLASQITGNTLVCSTACSTNNRGNFKVPHYWSFVRGIHWWQVDSHRKVPVMRKAFPYHQRHHHDDVIKWKHFSRNWSFVRGIHLSPLNSLHKGQWRGALVFSLICVSINDWVNNGDAGDLRRYRIHYDVTVMMFPAAVRGRRCAPTKKIHHGCGVSQFRRISK